MFAPEPATEETLVKVFDKLKDIDASLSTFRTAVDASLDESSSILSNAIEVLYVTQWTVAILVGVQFGLLLYDRLSRRRSRVLPVG